MKKTIVKYAGDESGATAIEYGLIAALIGVFIITAVSSAGSEIASTFDDMKAGLQKRGG